MGLNAYAVVGEHLGHSMSPGIHAQLLDMIDVAGVYGILEIPREKVPEIIPSLKVLGYAGINVTVPYKQLIMPYLDGLDADAKAIGAINTVHFQNGKAVGYNTDCFGYTTMLAASDIDPKGKDCVLIGCGGAGFAVIASYLKSGARSVKVFDISDEQLAIAKAQFPSITVINMATDKAACKGDILTNATPIGMSPKVENAVLTKEELQDGGFQAVADCVYNPLETTLVRNAKALGLKTGSGLWMLVYQAMRAQEIFQGQEIPREYATPLYNRLKKQFV